MAVSPATTTPHVAQNQENTAPRRIRPDGVINAKDYTWDNVRELYIDVPVIERTNALDKIATLKANEYPRTGARLAVLAVALFMLGLGATLIALACLPLSPVGQKVGFSLVAAMAIPSGFKMLHSFYTMCTYPKKLAEDKANKSQLLHQLIGEHNQQYLSRNPQKNSTT